MASTRPDEPTGGRGFRGRFDDLLRGAVPVAAARLGEIEAKSFRETYLEEALIAAIDDIAPEFTASRSGSSRITIPDWDRPLGGFDLRIRDDGLAQEALIEAKIDDVDQTLWDLFKLAGGLTMKGIAAGYLVVARQIGSWERGDCSSLFETGVRRTWTSAAMFEEWASAWSSLLRGGMARPVSVPAEIATEFIESAAVSGALGGYEIRVVAVHLVNGSKRLRFTGNWPDPRPTP